MSFISIAYLYSLRDNSVSDVVISSIDDICESLGITNKSDVAQCDIDKYHKVYFNGSEEVLKSGVSAWVNQFSRYNEVIRTWENCSDKTFVSGDYVLFVKCDDHVPVNATDDDLKFFKSCITI